jgi:1-aminocyclopropane-1-carboxylate deaminase/D-cysteine desulfhydrase-like pyridoxal-dependent ACC family enzyme
MIELPDIKKIKVVIDELENDFIKEKNVSLSVLRLDKIHPEISGNKFFKLYYFLEEAIDRKKKIITFGGAYSNHLAATAKACKMYGINCIGVVRGEQPAKLSHSLSFCKEQGMQLEFISRENYRKKVANDLKNKLKREFGDCILIPEGGYGNEGLEGAALISNFYSGKEFSHICCSAGTATTLAGLIKTSIATQTVIGFSALKGVTDFEERIMYLTGKLSNRKFCLRHDYHFGGYAKKTTELIYFMNELYQDFRIPTDFIYTGKMMFGVFDLIKKSYFPKGSSILCIHTGGLQGNLSLPAKTLNF